MSSFFSDDDADGRDAPHPRHQAATRGRSGRAAPRLARHLRQQPTEPLNAHASSSTWPSSPANGNGHGTSLLEDRSRGDSEVTALTDYTRAGKTSLWDDDAHVGHVPGGDFSPSIIPGAAAAAAAAAASDSDTPLSDVARLIRAWTRERGTPDIQPWQGDLVEECLHKLAQQGEMLELLRGDPKTSEEEHFKLIVVQTEMERVRYVVRAYLRCRLAKVEKYSQYITTTPDAQRLLSQLELSHAQKYTHLLHTHYTESVLQSLPEKLRGLDVDFGTQRSMVRKPDKTTPVLIYVKQDLPDLVLSTYVPWAIARQEGTKPLTLGASLIPENSGERAGLNARSMHLVRYELVERYIAEGLVEVL
ncbi:hypothetical protein NliqN6_2540 [Naganishia liquefaciens]|uniref:GINS subunit domain-containing protein n=1 Tax=Naganishia liquefaciens TaxID=104408 RepID=A0A8H3YEC9_9TREE|nr:hypothetical protein NliqN6_2540 [Naganishia liquefaciens]